MTLLATLQVEQLTLAIELQSDIAIPSDTPIITLEGVTLEILYSGKAGGIPSDISVFGCALVRLGGYDALAHSVRITPEMRSSPSWLTTSPPWLRQLLGIVLEGFKELFTSL